MKQGRQEELETGRQERATKVRDREGESIRNGMGRRDTVHTRLGKHATDRTI